MITIKSTRSNKLPLMILSIFLFTCERAVAMENSESAPLAQPDTPEQMLNEAAANWVHERAILAKSEKASNRCNEMLGGCCKKVGFGLFGLSGVWFLAAKYHADKDAAFIPVVFGLGCAAAGTVSAAVGGCLSNMKGGFTRNVKRLDKQYIAGTFRILTIKQNLNETQLTPEAQELLHLAQQNPFYLRDETQTVSICGIM